MMKHKQLLQGSLLAFTLALGLFAGCGNSDGGDGDGGMGGGGAGSTDSSTDTDFDLTTSSASGDGDGDGGGASTATGDGDDECGDEVVEAAPKETQMLLVVDTSESMDGTPTGFDQTKWETLVDSLNVALPAVQDKLGLGLKMFPSGDTESEKCSVQTGIEVDVALGESNLNDILSELEGESRAGEVQGDTPTAAALADALDYYTSGAGKDLSGDKFVLLATDGGPNCNAEPAVDCTCEGDPTTDKECGVRDMCTINLDASGDTAACALSGDWGSCCGAGQQELCLDDAGTVDAVEALASAGIKTIVLGMPGTEAYTDVLNALAEAGGVPASGETKYHKVDDPEGLTDTLTEITLNLITSCEIEVAEPPENANLVNVYLDDVVIPKNADDGWIYPNAAEDDYTVIELVGPTCTQVEQEGVEKISVKYGCTTIIR